MHQRLTFLVILTLSSPTTALPTAPAAAALLAAAASSVITAAISAPRVTAIGVRALVAIALSSTLTAASLLPVTAAAALIPVTATAADQSLSPGPCTDHRSEETDSSIGICPIKDASTYTWPSLIQLMMPRYQEVTPQTETDSSSGEDEEPRYRGPRMRSPLARAMYERMVDDRRHRSRSHKEWYSLDTSSYPADIAGQAVLCFQDAGTDQFLDNCYDKADWLFTQLYQGFMKSVLTWFMSVTSANAYLGRGSMFVFSRAHFRDLMRVDDKFVAPRMIDLGAGDGKVTEVMAAHYEQVYATEISPWMQTRLKSAGYSVLSLDEWHSGGRQYDLVSCLNLLDRCDRPMTILQQIRAALTPEGRLVVAVVLPYVPYVETTKDHQPTERLPVSGQTFSQQVLSLIQDVFLPAGFQLVSYSRLPYLCEGDMYRSFYVLNDAVFVLKLQS